MTSAALPANPFPGMNPYLENRRFWPGIHQLLIAELARRLAPRLRPEYIVRVEQRLYVSQEPAPAGGPRPYRVPDLAVLDNGAAAAGAGAATATVTATATAFKPQDEAVTVQLPTTDTERENYLEILRVDSREVVAVIEILSPTNKYGAGRREYLGKRAAVQYSFSHLVEIDLLRAGPPMPVVGAVPAGGYRILVRDASRAPDARLYAFGIRAPIPEFIMPLSAGAEGMAVSLKPILDDVYAIGSYDRDIDYGQDPPEPPLSEADRAWVDGLLREQGLRQ